jgi:hypothetical protein
LDKRRASVDELPNLLCMRQSRKMGIGNRVHSWKLQSQWAYDRSR